MGLKQVVLAILIALTLSTNSVTLSTYQTNVTTNTGITPVTVYVSSYDKAGTNLVTGANNQLTFYMRDGSDFLANPYNVTLNNTLIDAKFKDDGLWVAAIDNTVPNLYMLKIPTAGTQFAINQTISTGVLPTTLTWANNGNKLLVGLSNGTLLVYNLNTTINQFFLKQTIANAHIGSVAKVAGQISRVVSCGKTDTTVDIFNYNTTFDLYQLNQTLTAAVTGCTAIDLAQNEQRLVFGQSNGSILLSNAQGANIFGPGTAVTVPHYGSVNAVKFSSDAVFFITSAAAPDSTIHLYVKKNNFTVPSTGPYPVQTMGYAQPINEFALG
jgi:WD40 repeat protein